MNRPKDKKDALVQLYLQHGRRAIRPLCEELCIPVQSVVNCASDMGLYRGNRKTDNDKRWARARAIGKVIA